MTPFHHLVDVLDERAAHSKEAYRFVGSSGPSVESFAALARASHQVAHDLAPQVAAGDRALLLCSPGLAFARALFGCLRAGAIAVPAPLPSPGRPQRMRQRLHALRTSARPRLLLTDTAGADILDRSGLCDDVLADVTRVLVSSSPRPFDPTNTSPAVSAADEPTHLSPDTIAILQYTSGSTAAPKGIVLRHRHLLHNLAFIARREAHEGPRHSVSWLPVHHDMGLIEGVLQPLFADHSATLMAPAHFLQRPRRWLKAISDTGATISGGPDFAYRLCVERIPLAERDGLDLSRWRVAYNGAEPVRRSTLEAFQDAFGRCGFRRRAWFPVYGLAEATLAVSSGDHDEPARWSRRADGIDVVDCGRAGRETDVLVVTPETGIPVAEGDEGELWLRGPSVTEETFDAGHLEPTHDEHGVPSNALHSSRNPAGYLPTGDLGFRSNGRLHITGRRKHLLIVRGIKLHAEDLEATLDRAEPSIAAATVVQGTPGEELIVVAELTRSAYRTFRGDAVATTLRNALARDHELHVDSVVFVRPYTLPRASSGKLRRTEIRQQWLDGALTTVVRVDASGWALPPRRISPWRDRRMSHPVATDEVRS